MQENDEPRPIQADLKLTRCLQIGGSRKFTQVPAENSTQILRLEKVLFSNYSRSWYNLLLLVPMNSSPTDARSMIKNY